MGIATSIGTSKSGDGAERPAGIRVGQSRDLTLLRAGACVQGVRFTVGKIGACRTTVRLGGAIGLGTRRG